MKLFGTYLKLYVMQRASIKHFGNTVRDNRKLGERYIPN